MNKLRTANQLQDHLDGDFSWRTKEISSLRLTIRTAQASNERTLLRAGTALLYAHWEGFVKNASIAYLNFVDCQGLTYSELSTCFSIFGLKGKLSSLVLSKKSSANLEAFEFISKGLSQKSKLNLATSINTESNLSSAVFENIAISLGLSTAFYELRYKLIDESLLKRRNHIAHGEYLEIDKKAWEPLVDEVLLLMRSYKTDIENSAALKLYKRM